MFDELKSTELVTSAMSELRATCLYRGCSTVRGKQMENKIDDRWLVVVVIQIKASQT